MNGIIATHVVENMGVSSLIVVPVRVRIGVIHEETGA